jgi:hypothetical protein
MKKRVKHKKRRGRGRHSEQPSRRKPDLPTDEFCDWWNPSGVEEPSGASMGGHPDAERTWARKDPGRWTRRTYGINANLAWLSDVYRREYQRWLDAGKPEREKFVSLALTLKEQHEHWEEIDHILAQGDKSTYGPPEE